MEQKQVNRFKTNQLKTNKSKLDTQGKGEKTTYQQLMNLGMAWDRRGELERAISYFQQALALEPNNADANYNIGLALKKKGEIDAAIPYYQKAIKINSNHAKAYHNLGAAFYAQGKVEKAIAEYRKAIGLQPNYALAYNNLGLALLEEKKLEEAIANLRQAISLSPNSASFYLNLGMALSDQNKLEEAIAECQKGLKLEPNDAEAYNKLGFVFYKQDRIEEAIAHIKQAISLDPNSADFHTNLGAAFQGRNKLEEAIASGRQAIALNPHDPEAHFNYSLALLLKGELELGFAEYEWRQQHRKKYGSHYLDIPLWDGSSLPGKTILLHAEQGLGDTIQFIRYAALVREKCDRVIFECYAPLVPLLADVPGVDKIISWKDADKKEIDFRIPLMSLPHIFGTTLETIPADIPYLGNKLETTKLKLPQLNAQHKIGIVWAGSPTNNRNRYRSCSLNYFLELGKIPGVAVISLQKDISATGRETLQNSSIIDVSQQLKDFADTAAIIKELDLIISVDTAVAHLAGAMGKPVWLLLAFAPDWRWMLDREDSPWYPTIRLFRQQQPGDWRGVFTKVKQELQILGIPVEQALKKPVEQALKKPVEQALKKPVEQASCLLSAPSPALLSAPSPALPNKKVKTLGISWQLSLMTGWGVYGTHLTLQLLKDSEWEPFLMTPQEGIEAILNPLHKSLLLPLREKYKGFQEALKENPNARIACKFPVMFALGNNLETNALADKFDTEERIGMIFFEDTKLTEKALAKAKEYRVIIAGSTWTAEVLRSYGLTNIEMVPQGIDPTIFHPAPKSNLWSDRFIIFSGGKLEYRKGQDIIIAAFKQFKQRHPEALLLTAWHNFWPQYVRGIERTGNVNGLPKVKPNGSLEIDQWLIANGLNADGFINLGQVPNYQIGQILREADVAVFTNRCEGGTNLVAMECLASGIPTILSANTGHLDLIKGSTKGNTKGNIKNNAKNNICYPLWKQEKVQPTANFKGVDGWGESDVEEVVEMLEKIYYNREEAKAKGRDAANFMLDWSWEKQIYRLLKIIEKKASNN